MRFRSRLFRGCITTQEADNGQVCMLTHQLGFPLLEKAAYGMWGWEKLWEECGFDELKPHS